VKSYCVDGITLCFSLPYFTSTITIRLVLYLNSIKFTSDCREQWFIMMCNSTVDWQWETAWLAVVHDVHMWWLLRQFTLTTNTYYSAVESRRLSILYIPGIVSISWLSLGNSLAILAIWTRPCVLKHLSYPISASPEGFSRALRKRRPSFSFLLSVSSCLSFPSN